MPPPASNGKTVLITGINGYIASVLGQLLLNKGYSVRGTTRRAASTEPLLAGPYASFVDRIKIYEVPDITISGAFDEASKGVDGIFHTASPIDFRMTTYEDVVVPAVKGTESILESALKAGPQLKALVVTSSVIACTNPKDDLEYTFTEKDYASASLERAIKDLEEGNQTPAGILYGASKTAADRIVWKWKEEHKPSFAVSTINPSVVIGPPIILPSSGSNLNETLRPFFDLFSGNAKEIGPPIGTGSFVDVRDVAFMHVWAFENPKYADGERFISCEGFGPLQAASDVLRREYEGTDIGKRIFVGSPGEGYVGFDKESGKVEKVTYPAGRLRVSGKKAEEVMGFKYVTYPQSIIDTAKALQPLL